MAAPSPSDIHDGPTHLPGVTRSCFSRDGATIFTGGADVLVRIHKAREPNSEPGFFDEHREEITCMDCSEDRLLTGSVDGKVRSFTYPENQFDAFITSAGAVPIRWLTIDKAGERVAVCSDELLIKVVNIKDTAQTTLIALSKPVRSASWHPSDGTLTVVSTDGKIFVYELLETGASCLKVIDGLVAPSKSDNEPPPVVAWHPNGEYFVVASKSQEIAIVDRDSWTKQGTFSTDGHDAEIGMLAWSPNGLYLASSGKDDQVIVWQTEDRKPLMRYKNPNETITSLNFSPTDNAISFTTLNGKFITWNDPVPADHPHPARTNDKRSLGNRGAADDKTATDALFDDEGEGEDLADLDDDWIIDDEGGEGGARYGEREKSLGVGAKEVVSVSQAQAPFQPGATLMKDKKRYLAFNMIGVIDVTDQDSHHVVNVEFHDKSSRRGYHFQDHSKYTAAALGERGIVYAAAAEPGHPAVVHYRAYDAWASQSDWQVNLPEGEDVILVASGGRLPESNYDDDFTVGNVVVGTTKGYVRFFSGSGLQRYLWRMGEELVSMVAGKDLLFMIHREGGTSLDGCQNLRYTLIDLVTFDVVQDGRIPLPKRTTLTWVGFAEYGAPLIYDSTGMLSVLDRYGRPGQARWIPLLDSNTLARKQGKDESYWPVGVTEKQFMCVILKGSQREPGFPRPIVLDLDMHMPLLNLDVTQGQLEEKFVRGSMQVGFLKDSLVKNPDLAFDISQREVELDKELLQLVQAACKADKLQRALDIVKLMHNPATVDAASKVAGFYHLPGLQEKIGLVLESMEDRKREKEQMEARSLRRSLPQHAAMLRSSKPMARMNIRDTTFAPRTNFSRRTGAAAVVDRVTESPYPDLNSGSFVAETPEVELEPTSFSRLSDSPPSAGKRKRSDDQEENQQVVLSPNELEVEPQAKRAQTDMLMGPPKTVPSKNPFARKPAASSNPFARPADGRKQNALKSTSFFERVDNIEHDKAKGKSGGKPGKGKEKQTTLLGMVSVDAPKTKAKGSKDKQAGSEIAPPRADTAPDDLPDDRQSLIEHDAETLEETQQETLEETLQETLSPAAAQRSLPEGTEDELAEVEWSESERGDGDEDLEMEEEGVAA